MSELNQKDSTIKFDYKFDFKQVEFLDTLICIDNKINYKLIFSENQVKNVVINNASLISNI